jgi:hypothetical protein
MNDSDFFGQFIIFDVFFGDFEVGQIRFGAGHGPAELLGRHRAEVDPAAGPDVEA